MKPAIQAILHDQQIAVAVPKGTRVEIRLVLIGEHGPPILTKSRGV